MPIDSIKWDREKVNVLISESTHYWGETDLNALKTQGLKGANLLPEGKSLPELFTSYKNYKKVRNSLIKSFQIDLNNYHYLKPLLLQHIFDSRISGGVGQIMDQYLWSIAESNNIPVDGLETIDSQVRTLNSIDLDFQKNILKSIASHPSRYRKKIKAMIHDYNNSDIRSLYKKGLKSCGKYRNLLIYQRNINMVDSIQALPNGRHFISIGAGHLYGNKGILALLKRSGADVNPVININ